MATYVNDLRLKEIATGDEDGTWGTSTNTNLSLIADAFSYGTEQLAGDANETFTMADGTADGVRSLFLKITSAGSLTATRTVTLGPNTVSKVWIIQNATTGGQAITIAQGSGATVTIDNGDTAMVYTDGAGAGAAVTDANPTIAGGIAYVYKTANYTMSDNEGVLANTSGGAFTVTLPASPTAGMQCVIADSGGMFGTNNLTAGRNGSTIDGTAADLILDINDVSVQFVYSGTTWNVYAQVGGNGGSINLATQVTGVLPRANGGTGLSTAGTSGNILTSNGTDWVSSAPAASGVSQAKATMLALIFGF